MRQLGPDQPGYDLEAIGKSGEQPPHERIEEMAAAYIAAIQTVQPAGPYRLGGWSFGGVVAFEMAQRLQHQGHAVSLLALFDCKAPQLEPEPEMDDKALMSRFVKELGGGLGKPLPKLLRRLQQRRGDQRLQWIWKQLGATGLVPPDVDLAYIEQLFKIFAANERALRQYSPQPSAFPIVLFLARMSFDAPAKVVDSWQQLNDRSRLTRSREIIFRC